MAGRVLVTGGLGYLGSVLCEHLLNAGFSVTALDNLMYGTGQQGLYHLCANPACGTIIPAKRGIPGARIALKCPKCGQDRFVEVGPNDIPK